jgi:hypothetical protein
LVVLRSLYFLLAGVMDKFHYLKLGLSIVLVFIGAKMLATAADIHVPIGLSLGIVAGVLVGSVVLSLLRPKQAEEHLSHDPLVEGDEPPGPVIRSETDGIVDTRAERERQAGQDPGGPDAESLAQAAERRRTQGGL